MSNKKRRARKHHPAGTERNSARITKGTGAQPYNDETISRLQSLVPSTEFVLPNGQENEGDMDRLSRARAMANAFKKAYAAVIRLEALATRYFQELALNSAHELYIMHSKIRHVNATTDCPFSTCIVVFRPGHHDRIENGLCPIYWEPIA
jgi:hypothetical protein